MSQINDVRIGIIFVGLFVEKRHVFVIRWYAKINLMWMIKRLKSKHRLVQPPLPPIGIMVPSLVLVSLGNQTHK